MSVAASGPAELVPGTDVGLAEGGAGCLFVHCSWTDRLTTVLERPAMVKTSVSPEELETLRLECFLSPTDAASLLGVSLRTWWRWRSSSAPAWVRALLHVHAGYPPWDGWEGWRFGAGVAWPPGYLLEVTPGQVMAVPYRLQLIASLRRRIREFDGLTDQEAFQQLLSERHL